MLLAAFVILTLPFLYGCKSDRMSRNLLCDVLYSSYSAKAEYLMDSGEKYLEGSLELLRADKTKINFLSPDEYASVSVSGDSSGEGDVFCFELYGIPADVPKSIAGDMSLLFSIFSDELPSVINSLEDECFTLYEKDDSAAVSFTIGSISYTVVYSTATGIPTAVNAKDDKSAVNISFEEFQLSEN